MPPLTDYSHGHFGAASEYEMEEHQEANSQYKWKGNDLEICSGGFRQKQSTSLIDDTDWDLVLTGDVNESLINWESQNFNPSRTVLENCQDTE